MKYQIYYRLTGEQVGTLYTNKKRAKARAEKLDMEIGGYRYGVREIDTVNNTSRAI